MKLTFQEIRIIATDPCIANQLRDVNTIGRRSWYIAAHIWKIYDIKIEVVPFIIYFSTDLTTVVSFSIQINIIIEYLTQLNDPSLPTTPQFLRHLKASHHFLFHFKVCPNHQMFNLSIEYALAVF
jgi:hypothetical protein